MMTNADFLEQIKHIRMLLKESDRMDTLYGIEFEQREDILRAVKLSLLRLYLVKLTIARNRIMAKLDTLDEESQGIALVTVAEMIKQENNIKSKIDDEQKQGTKID